ncbi:MAG TPA: hypothetical protein VGA50_04685 [Kiloniellales bacterium]
MMRFLVAAAAAFFMLAACAAASPEPPPDPIVRPEKSPIARAMQCGARADMLQALRKQYGERSIGAGISPRSDLIEVTASSDGATFTILISRADGYACLLGHGTDWRARTPEPKGPQA